MDLTILKFQRLTRNFNYISNNSGLDFTQTSSILEFWIYPCVFGSAQLSCLVSNYLPGGQSLGKSFDYENKS